MPDYANHLEAVRQLRSLGATKIKLGDLEVEFPSVFVDEPEEPSRHPLLTDEPEDEVSRLREWRALQYHSSTGG